MDAAAQHTGTELIRIETYGVRIDIRIAQPELVPKVLPVLPPGWRPASDSFPDAEFSLLPEGSWRYMVGGDGAGSVSQAVDLDLALAFLEARLRHCVALWAPEHVFVHAGVVAHNGRALVIPGDSFSGKTTLVAALVRAGATYFSDEFAVLDLDGFVHPYAKPLSLRSPTGEPAEEVPASTLGAPTSDARAPVGLIVDTSYVPDARWNPSPVSPGEAVLSLLLHTVPAQERPSQSLRALRRVAERCVCLRSERGEAVPIVDSLLALLAAS